MRLEEALFDYLSTDPGISALVNDHVYPVRLPEGAPLPAVSFHRVSAERIYTHEIFSETDAWVRARVQVDCWSQDSAEQAMDVGDAVLAALSGYEGDMSGELIGSSFVVNEFDTYEAPTKIHRRILEFMVAYEDNVTT